MRVFIAIASARLAYGGPAVSVVALAKGLARAGVDTGLWCPDDSASEVAKADDAARLCLLTGSLRAAMRQFGAPDVIHDNGLWWSHNHRIARYASRQRVPPLPGQMMSSRTHSRLCPRQAGQNGCAESRAKPCWPAPSSSPDYLRFSDHYAAGDAAAGVRIAGSVSQTTLFLPLRFAP